MPSRERLRTGGRRRSPRFTSTTDSNDKSSKSTTRLGRRTSRRKDERATEDSNVEQESQGSEDDLSCYGRSEARQRRRKRRSIDHMDVDEDGWNGDDGRHEIKVTQKGKAKSMYSPLPLLPEKRTLELVIDILQRRDTYEAFGEPIDPDEVQDYYQVVKEPMDFGTMRAKLHEGMYMSLEEFEHDAFLIPQNGRLFNSPSSVYYKQAQAIEELAKKVFHLLKTEPEKLKTDFPETRRRSRRKPPEPKNGKSKQGDSPDAKLQNFTTILSSNNFHKPCLSASLYADKAAMQSYSLIGGTCCSEDARSSYRPWIRFSRESDSTFSTVCRSSMHLEEVRVGETELLYKHSLMRFARGLGPVAQKVVARKLQATQQAKVPTCFEVQLQPATFQYPAKYPSQGPSTYTSLSTSSSMSSKFPIPSQEPFSLAKHAEVWHHVNQAQNGEKPNATTGIGAKKGNANGMGENGTSQIRRDKRYQLRKTVGMAFVLPFEVEKTAKSRRDIRKLKTHPAANIATTLP